MRQGRTRTRLIVLSFISLGYILWPRFRGAPWAPTSMRKAHKMLTLAQVQPNEIVYDLGSGDGRMLIMAARRFGARAVGIEIDPVGYLWTRLMIMFLGLRRQIRVVRGNLFEQDLSEADVITCYLLPRTNERLVNKLKQELRTGTRVVANRFALPGWSPIRQDSAARVYVYRVGDEQEKGGRDD